MKAHALVVEDEPDIAQLMKHALERGGEIAVDIVPSGDAALRKITEQPPNLIVLDLNLPVLDGIDICRIVRSRDATRHIPIVIVTARTDEDDRVKGLEIGADDYVVKPFSMREFVARVRALLRRAAPRDRQPISTYRGVRLVVDFDAVAVTVEGAPVRLTRREFELLRYLIQNKSRVVSRERLLERVWGYDQFLETRSVDVHVGRLRKKLGEAGRQIETMIGLGYRFVD